MRRMRIIREAQRTRNDLEEIIQGREERNRSQRNGTSDIPSRTNNVQHSRQEQNQTNSSGNHMSTNGTDSPRSSSVSAQTCVVCLSEQREVILMNCGHVCVCANCAMEIMATRPLCPVCRANIERVAPAFIA